MIIPGILTAYPCFHASPSEPFIRLEQCNSRVEDLEASTSGEKSNKDGKIKVYIYDIYVIYIIYIYIYTRIHTDALAKKVTVESE